MPATSSGISDSRRQSAASKTTPSPGLSGALADLRVGHPRGHELGDAEPRMVREELDEALADGAGGAEDCDRDALGPGALRWRFHGESCSHGWAPLQKLIL